MVKRICVPQSLRRHFTGDELYGWDGSIAPFTPAEQKERKIKLRKRKVRERRMGLTTEQMLEHFETKTVLPGVKLL